MRHLFLALALSIVSPAHSLEILNSANAEKLFVQPDRLVLFWSLECPPCFKEMAMLRDLLQEHPNLAVALISTDADSDRYREVDEVYESIHGTNLETWVFSSGNGDALIFQIDREWYGELPRSYFVKKNGERIAHSGLLSIDELTQWFNIK